VEAGSLVAGAEQLGISHPSVSNHMKALEGQFGCQLFLRRRGSISSLTEQGRRLYERATRLIEEAQLLSRDLAPNRAGSKQPRLTITTQRVLAQSVLRRPIGDFVRSESDVELVLDVGIFEQTLLSVASGKADICCVMTFGPIAELESEVIGRERFGFYVAPHHPLANRKRVSVAELSRQTFVATRRDGHYGQMIHNLLRSIGIAGYHVAYQIQEGMILNDIAAQGRAVACSFVPAAEDFVRNGMLVEVSVDATPLFADLHLIWPPRRRPGRLGRHLADIIRKRLKERLE